MAGAALLESLLATVPEADFLVPGRSKEGKVGGGGRPLRGSGGWCWAWPVRVHGEAYVKVGAVQGAPNSVQGGKIAARPSAVPSLSLRVQGNPRQGIGSAAGRGGGRGSGSGGRGGSGWAGPAFGGGGRMPSAGAGGGPGYGVQPPMQPMMAGEQVRPSTSCPGYYSSKPLLYVYCPALVAALPYGHAAGRCARLEHYEGQGALSLPLLPAPGQA